MARVISGSPSNSCVFKSPLSNRTGGKNPHHAIFLMTWHWLYRSRDEKLGEACRRTAGKPTTWLKSFTMRLEPKAFPELRYLGSTPFIQARRLRKGKKQHWKTIPLLIHSCLDIFFHGQSENIMSEWKCDSRQKTWEEKEPIHRLMFLQKRFKANPSPLLKARYLGKCLLSPAPCVKIETLRVPR